MFNSLPASKKRWPLRRLLIPANGASLSRPIHFTAAKLVAMAPTKDAISCGSGSCPVGVTLRAMAVAYLSCSSARAAALFTARRSPSSRFRSKSSSAMSAPGPGTGRAVRVSRKREAWTTTKASVPGAGASPGAAGSLPWQVRGGTATEGSLVRTRASVRRGTERDHHELPLMLGCGVAWRRFHPRRRCMSASVKGCPIPARRM